MGRISDVFETLVVLDTETTGLFPQRDEIIEFGGQRLKKAGDGFVPDGELDCFITLRDGRPIPPKIVELTGITQALLDREGIPGARAAEQIASLLTGNKVLCVAFNAQFDLCFLYYFLARYGYADCLRQMKFLDALTVYKDRRPYPHRLCNAIEAYHLSDCVNSHRAVDDAAATVQLLAAMEAEKEDILNYVNLFGYHPKFGVSGKRISSIRYVPQPYEAHLPLYMR